MKNILPPATAPTNLPAGHRRTARVVLPARRPSTVAERLYAPGPDHRVGVLRRYRAADVGEVTA
ncbi:hypothetical protein OG705_29065 [Streptomyces sp. NBC_00838]|uniref:hypothetical protein n=1 Tax=Streptomyces sp. NBC_00838 TaxID=2903680 RepID=UPI00386C1F0D|nr:hypothetical protein OG705_29065 [Streptomyces sp. NBC_00838]